MLQNIQWAQHVYCKTNAKNYDETVNVRQNTSCKTCLAHGIFYIEMEIILLPLCWNELTCVGRAGHATTQSRQCYHVFRLHKCWLLYSLRLLHLDAESLTFFIFFRVTEVLLYVVAKLKKMSCAQLCVQEYINSTIRTNFDQEDWWPSLY